MPAFLVVSCFVLVSLLNADLFETLEKVESNAADCTKLSIEQNCSAVGACMWTSPGGCIKDPCYERRVLSGCPTGVTGVTCGRVKKSDGTDSQFCVTDSRVASFDSDAKICSLEWGEFKIPEIPLCKTAGTGCGELTAIEVQGTTYYVCGPGSAETGTDPCSYLSQEICGYVGQCMWSSDQCVTDECWEKTYSTLDSCRDGCGVVTAKQPVQINTAFGYCKSLGHDLVSKCNADTATNSVTKLALCTGYPSECDGTVTISKFDGSDFYVCNTEDKEFTVEGGAASLNSFIVAFVALILLVAMM